MHSTTIAPATVGRHTQRIHGIALLLSARPTALVTLHTQAVHGWTQKPLDVHMLVHLYTLHTASL